MLRAPQNKAQRITRRAIAIAEHFMHIEATSGVVLLITSLFALYLANSSFAAFYHELWHSQFGFHFGSHKLSWDLHFWVNDVLMTLFFLIVGVEIKQELVTGALANFKQALLPIIAACGGVLCPALFFIFFNHNTANIAGWAIPTATDIAFAIGILALLGKSIPHNVRIVLLSLAIIDDIIAIIIIALFYSQNIDLSGFYIIGTALLIVLFFRYLAFDFLPLYIAPGILLWYGLFKTGIHPSIAGVMLGLLTPTVALVKLAPSRSFFEEWLSKLKRLEQLEHSDNAQNEHNKEEKKHVIKEAKTTTRSMLPACERIQNALHGWVAFVIMPLFAFANAGVELSGITLSEQHLLLLFLGIMTGLIFGKPLGIVVASFLAIKLKLCRLPENVSWAHMWLIGILAGIGFTMAIFVTLLAFASPSNINIAKISVLIASGLSALAGLGWGIFLRSKESA